MKKILLLLVALAIAVVAAWFIDDAIGGLPFMMALIIPISGRAGRCQFNGVNINITEFNGTISTTTGPITGFEDQNVVTGRTAENRADGNDDFKATIKGPVDTTLMPSAALLTQGSILTNVKLFLDKAVGARWNGSTRCIVKQIVYTTKEDSVASEYTAEIENAGGTITNAS